MADFLTTNGISYQIEELIRSSKDELILVTPYLKLSKILYERLKDANGSGVKITLIYGKEELKQPQLDNLNTLENFNLYYLDNLHAKCYINENKLIICSMNLYEFSEKNNREMGVIIDKIEDQHLYENVRNEVVSIINASECKKSVSSIESDKDIFSFYLYFLKQKYPNERLILNQKTNEYENVEYEIECLNFMKSSMDFNISHRTDICLNFPEHKLNKVFNSINLERLNRNFRIFWNYPTSPILVYKYTDKEYTPEQSIEYYLNAIEGLCKELDNIS